MPAPKLSQRKGQSSRSTFPAASTLARRIPLDATALDWIPSDREGRGPWHNPHEIHKSSNQPYRRVVALQVSTGESSPRFDGSIITSKSTCFLEHRRVSSYYSRRLAVADSLHCCTVWGSSARFFFFEKNPGPYFPRACRLSLLHLSPWTLSVSLEAGVVFFTSVNTRWLGKGCRFKN